MPTAVEPSEAQIAAGNYVKKHVRFQGLDLAIETPKGGERRGIDPLGVAWSVTMPADYGYIKRTTGADDEQVDCYLGPDAESIDVWVIDQVREGSTAFDEHKVMLGFGSKGEALAAYKASFSDGKGADRIGRVTHCTIEEFTGEVAAARGGEFRGDTAEKPAFSNPPADATDHEVAEGMRDGKYASPQQYGDFWLFDLRITGTGMAWRDSLEEWAFRDKDLWLSEAFVQRCNGLPVIFGHPDRAGLNSEEYAERAIGTIVLPYIKGDEVWGIGKIFDAGAARAMQDTHRSTSPGVTPPKGSTPLLLELGTEAQNMGAEAQSVKVLAEGLPLILDHLAVCEAGVWDKDGPPDGIRLDSIDDAPIRKDASVTAEEKAAIEAERDDAKSRADAAETELAEIKKADKARKDAADAAIESDKEALEAAEKGKADAKRDSRKDRHAKHDGEIMDCSRCDSEESEEAEKAKNDAAAAAKTPVEADRGVLVDSKFASMQATLDRQAAQIAAMTAPPSIEDSNEIAKAWGRWDSLYQALGDQTPQAYPGEKPRAYLRRLADGVRKYTDSWKSYVFHDSQQTQDFDAVSNLIFAEALAHSKKPAPYGTISDEREIVSVQHGKTRTEFQGGDPFFPFKHARKFAVIGIRNPNTGTVYSS